MKNPKSKIQNPKSRSDMLLEIGTEELPAAYLPDVIDQLRAEAQRSLREASIACDDVETGGTPRRLILLIHGVSPTQRKPAEEIRGPSKQAAFDAGGAPTPALKGFLASRGGTISQVKVVATEKGAYVYLVKPPTTTPTATVLPSLLEELIGRVRAPKTMRWDESGVRFARPIRWLLALYGSSPLRIRVGRLVSGRVTFVGGPAQPRAITISTPARYFVTLKHARILWDPRTRCTRIQTLVRQAAGRHRGRVATEMLSHGLLDEVTHLVERPTPLVGHFDRKYLTLPREVLLASMAKHQRVFALDDAKGKLLPTFVAILDGAPQRLAQVGRVHEHILNARLADSLFFWEQDHQQLPLEQLAGRLHDVTVHERLGSMAQKTERLQALSPVLATMWRLTDEESRHLHRACGLAKTDLVTAMVKEFPTLQGVMGNYYARDSREPSAVATAIEEQYLPQGSRLPATVLGGALSLLDKYDTLTSYFGLGIEPTGDQDPFGLRRCAQGIVEIAWQMRRPLSLPRLFEVRATLPPFTSDEQRRRVNARVTTYLRERLATFAWPTPVPPRDVIDAVLASPFDDLVDAMTRMQALTSLLAHPLTLKAAKVIERTHNILKAVQLDQQGVDPGQFTDPLEHRLWERYTTTREPLLALIHAKDYAQATTRFGEAFFDLLHEFFSRVMVNDPNAALARNRLALMRTINALYTEGIADLSKLAILQPSTMETEREAHTS